MSINIQFGSLFKCNRLIRTVFVQSISRLTCSCIEATNTTNWTKRFYQLLLKLNLNNISNEADS